MSQAASDVVSTTDVVAIGAVEGRSPWQLFWGRFRQDRFALVGVAFIIILILLAIFAPFIANSIAHHGPNDVYLRQMTDEFGLPKGPTSAFYFGADTAGQDVFVRTVYGARTSLVIALFATGISVFIGVSLGLIAGYYRGKVDTAVSRFTDVMMSLPVLILALGLASACSGQEGCFIGFKSWDIGVTLKPGLVLVSLIIGLFSWPYIARIVRGQVFSLREKEFIEAARAQGAGGFRIMSRELLPNLAAPIIVYATLIIPSNILFEAALSFLGAGVPPSTPSWGEMLSRAGDIFQVAWWLMFFPGLFLFLTTLSFNLVGDGLRDALDPRSSRS